MVKNLQMQVLINNTCNIINVNNQNLLMTFMEYSLQTIFDASTS